MTHIDTFMFYSPTSGLDRPTITVKALTIGEDEGVTRREWAMVELDGKNERITIHFDNLNAVREFAEKLDALAMARQAEQEEDHYIEGCECARCRSERSA